MAEIATIARPYAEALMKASGANAAALAAEIGAFGQVAADAAMRHFADNPKIDAAQVFDVLTSVAKMPSGSVPSDAAKIREGLSAADKAKAELAAANLRVEQELSSARNDAAQRLADAERLAQSMIEEAKGRASDEGAKIIAAAHAEAQQEATKAREALREQVAALAVKGAEQILRREVDARAHAELLGRLQAEL